VGFTLTWDGDNIKLVPRPPEIKAERPPDSLATSTEFFLRGQHTHLPSIDLSSIKPFKIEAPKVIGVTDIERKAFDGWEDVQVGLFGKSSPFKMES